MQPHHGASVSPVTQNNNEGIMSINQMITAGYRACVSRKINIHGEVVEIWWWRRHRS